MLEKIYIVTDLGPGDGGKGGVVHVLAHALDASITIKRGGAQGSHGVCRSCGDSFKFSQWGCGTLEGIPTYCSEQMVLSPVVLDYEADALKKQGFANPYFFLSVDANCLCATPYHKIASEIEELLLRGRHRGTVGTGVGQAYRMSQRYGDELNLRAKDLTDCDRMKRVLIAQQFYYHNKYCELSDDSVLPEDRELLWINLDLLEDLDYISFCLDLFQRVGRNLTFKSLDTVISQNHGNAIVECSHGVLTDAEVGLKPHVSAIRTLPKFTVEMLRTAGFAGEIFNLGVHRAYASRHGAGPLPTYRAKFTESVIPDLAESNNRWQGAMRAGPLDLNLLSYALKCCQDTPMDGLCLTCFDQLRELNGVWQICAHYCEEPEPDEDYVDFLKYRAVPIIEKYPVRIGDPLNNPADAQRLLDRVSEILSEHIHVPLAMLSLGPTEKDKIMTDLIRR